MTELWRLLLVAARAVVAWLIVRWWERRLGRGSVVTPGLTVIVTPTCLICPDTIAALHQADPELDMRILDATVDDVSAYGVRSAPTVVVADRSGTIRLRRTGRASVTDAEQIVAAAREMSVAA